MFMDLRGRELHLGDLVIHDFDVIILDYSYGVLVADNKIAYVNGGIKVTRKNTSCFLIENPTDDELKIKERIVKSHNLHLEQKIKEKTNKSKLGTSYQVGDILSCPSFSSYFVYLGKINLLDLTENKLNFSGNMYLSVPIFTDNLNIRVYNHLQNVFKLNFNDYNVMIEEYGKETYGGASTNEYLFITKGKSSRFTEKVGHVDVLEFNHCCLNYYKVLPLGSVKHILLQLNM